MAEEEDEFNLFKEAEVAAVNTIAGDDWLKAGGTGGVKTVHRKLRRSETGEPVYQSVEDELPAIGVWCQGTAGEEEESLGESEQVLVLLFDVVAFGSDPDTVDDLCKEIACRLRRLFRIQVFVDDFDEATQMDGFAEGGDIQVDPQTVFATYQNAAGWWAEAATSIKVTIYRQQ